MLGIYCRVSTGNQAIEGLSLDIQREKGIKFAKKHDMEYQLYVDAGISGASLEREQLQQMLTDIAAKKIDSVFVVSKDRLTRATMSEAIGLREFFQEHKVKLYIDGSLNSLDSPEDLLQQNVLDSIAEFQRLLIKKKTTEGRQKQIDSGDKTFPIYGYYYTYAANGKKIWHIHEDEAELVRKVFKMYLEEGLSYLDITRRLISEGYKTKRGGTFDLGTIAKILKRPEYTGLTLNTKGELIKSNHYEPIVDQKIWEKVQDSIAAHTVARQEKAFRSADNEVSAILRCEYCGGKFFYNRNSSPSKPGVVNEFYAHKKTTVEQRKCPGKFNYIKKAVIDYAVRAIFYKMFENTEDIKKYMDLLQSELNRDTEDIVKSIARFESRIAELEKQRKRLVDAVKMGVMEAVDIKDDLQSIKKELEVQNNGIDAQKSQLAIKSEKTRQVIEKFAEDIIGKLQSATPKLRRDMYLMYLKEITIKDSILTIESITGNRISMDIMNIPDEFKDYMASERYYDLHPEERNYQATTLSDAIFSAYPENYYKELPDILKGFKCKKSRKV